MTKAKVKTVSRDTLSVQLHTALDTISNKRERQKVVRRMLQQLNLQEVLQQMDYQSRMVFWQCNYYVFNFLRVQGQLPREAGEFDKDVKQFLTELLGSLLEAE